MPIRTVASSTQRALFERLSAVPFVLGAKPENDYWSVNLHGRFVLYDKDWSAKTQDSPHETLLAMRAEDAVSLTLSGEPLVHLHIDWGQIRWARFQVQALPLIGTDRVVAFYAKQEITRIFALYCLDKDVQGVMKLDEWLDLKS